MSIITSTELASWLGIDDNEDDVQLQTATAAANQAVAEYCGRVFDKTATADASARTFWPESQSMCIVTDFWETSVLAVKVDFGDDGVYDTTWTLNTDFFLEPLNGLVDGQAWPYSRIVSVRGQLFPCWSRRPSVQVTAAWGWASIPAAVKQAAFIKAGKLFRRKDSIDGVIGGFADFTPLRISSREDPDVVSLLAPFQTSDATLLIA